MLVFESTQPILQRKQTALDVQDLEGLLRLRVQFWNWTLFSGIYTRIDQVFLLWGLITGVIFLTAQFLTVSWMTQAVLWSVLTLAGSIGTVALTWYWVTIEEFRWVVYYWVALMGVGVVLTNMGLFGGWWQILEHLCPLWLGLSAIGYLGTAWGMRSRAFLFNGILHLLGIVLLPYFLPWQYLVTGAVMAGSLFFLAEMQWDMQSVSSYSMLDEVQRKFNYQQLMLRQQR